MKKLSSESRLWNLDEPAAGETSNLYMDIKPILMGYMWNDIHVEQMNNISSSSKNLTSMSLPGKNAFLRLFTNYKHKNANTNDAFNRFATYSWTTFGQFQL